MGKEASLKHPSLQISLQYVIFFFFFFQTKLMILFKKSISNSLIQISTFF